MPLGCSSSHDLVLIYAPLIRSIIIYLALLPESIDGSFFGCFALLFHTKAVLCLAQVICSEVKRTDGARDLCHQRISLECDGVSFLSNQLSFVHSSLPSVSLNNAMSVSVSTASISSLRTHTTSFDLFEIARRESLLQFFTLFEIK